MHAATKLTQLSSGRLFVPLWHLLRASIDEVARCLASFRSQCADTHHVRSLIQSQASVMPITLQSMKKRLSQYKQEAKRHSLGPDAFNVFKSPARPSVNSAVTGPVNPDDTDHLLRPGTADTGKMSIDPSRPGTADSGMMPIDNVAMTSPMSMDEIVAASPADVDMAASPIHSGTDTAGEQSLLYLAISWGLMARSHDKKAHAEEVYSLGNKIFGTSAWSVNAAESANWALGKVPVPLGRVTVEELRQRSKVRPQRPSGPVDRPQTMLW